MNEQSMENELVRQGKMLCRDFIYCRITREGLSWSQVKLQPPVRNGTTWDASVVLLKLGDELENLRPHVYRNIANQLNISVASEAVVSYAFLSVTTEILSLGITWGKVVAIFAVAGGLAVDCVRQGHPAVVHTIEECLGEFVRKSLAFWLKRRGGWGDILKCVRNSKTPAQPHWLASVMSTCKHLLKIMYIYLIKEL